MGTLDPGWRRVAAALVEQHGEALGQRCMAAVAGRLEVLGLLGDMARDAAPLLDLNVGQEEGWEEDSLEAELRLSIGGHSLPPPGGGKRLRACGRGARRANPPPSAWLKIRR